MQSIGLEPTSPAGFEPSSTLYEEISDVRTVEVAHDFRIGYTMLNLKLAGEAAPIIAFGGFNSDLTTPSRGWEGFQLARLGRPVLMLDMPGHGLSSPHSRQQIIDLTFRRDSTSQAIPMIDAIQKLLDPLEPADVWGLSHGAELGLRATELDPHDRIHTTFALDLPAVKRQSTIGLQIGYLLKDNVMGRKKYLESLEGTDVEQDFTQFEVDFNNLGVDRAPGFARNNTGLFLLNLVASVNARPVSLQSWAKIMNEKSARITAVTSAEGHVSDPEVIEEFIRDLSPEQQARSRQIVVPDEDHNIGIVHLMPRAVAWAQEAFAA